MRTFSKTLDLPSAMQWMAADESRGNLCAIVDLVNNSVPRIGKHSTLQAFLAAKAKTSNRAKQFWRIMSYADMEALAKRATAPKEAVEPSKATNTALEQMVADAVSAALKRFPATPLPEAAAAYVTEIRQFEQQGLELIRRIAGYERHNPLWTQEGAVDFQKATMALMRAITLEGEREAETAS